MSVYRIRMVFLASLAVIAAAAAPVANRPGAAVVPSDGVVQLRSVYSMDETISRIRQDITANGIMFFTAIDQSALAARAGIPLHPSTLLIFGNPALGVQFITSNPAAGIDWPVRLLVWQDDAGAVWAAYTDFAWIARRHHISDRDTAFGKASAVITSITSSISAP